MFEEGKGMFWLLGGVAITLIPLFPEFVVNIANLLGVDYAPAFILLMGVIFSMFIIFRQDQDITSLKERVKELAQRNALIEEELRKLVEKSKMVPKQVR